VSYGLNWFDIICYFAVCFSEKYIELYHMPVNRKASFLIELVCTRKGRLVATFRDVLI